MIETYTQINQNLKNDKFSKIYLLMGEESFFIDKISNYFENIFIEESQKGFNQEIHYGKDSTISKILNSSKSFPMMSDKKLIIVKESKELDIFKNKNSPFLENFIEYINNPNPTTTLVFCLKNKKLDKRSKIYKSIEKNAVVLDTDSKENKIYDNQIPRWINKEAEDNGYSIDDEATFLILENIGNNLVKITNALEKIYINKKDKNINIKDVEFNIGINRDYNYFELQDSLVEKNIIKCTKIFSYFNTNQKLFPIQKTIIYLFSFYYKLLIIKSQNISNPNTISSTIAVHPYVAKSYSRAFSSYTLIEIKLILKNIKKLDLISKGIYRIKNDENSLLNETVFKIFIKK
tara:strand:- start:323 stop:1366 length:1044 start_codon:yes stop_codon:yes gene_type:complete